MELKKLCSVNGLNDIPASLIDQINELKQHYNYCNVCVVGESLKIVIISDYTCQITITLNNHRNTRYHVFLVGCIDHPIINRNKIGEKYIGKKETLLKTVKCIEGHLKKMPPKYSEIMVEVTKKCNDAKKVGMDEYQFRNELVKLEQTVSKQFFEEIERVFIEAIEVYYKKLGDTVKRTLRNLTDRGNISPDEEQKFLSHLEDEYITTMGKYRNYK
ncbi:hypothetical protein QTN25_009316 [Entamoeba marina]